VRDWSFAILILALGASALNAWYYGSVIVEARARAEDERWKQSFSSSTFAGYAADPQSWYAAERRAWRIGISVEIVILTAAGIATVLVRRQPAV
jgi:hypothetical protein